MILEKKFKYWSGKQKTMSPPFTIKELLVVGINPILLGKAFDALELIQYIGFKDCNNKDIYEGHLVKRYCPCGNCDQTWLGEICWRESSAGFVFRDYDKKVDSPIEMYSDDDAKKALLEIVGNKFENSEMLKGKK